MVSINAPDDWLLKGISDWIEFFNSKQIHVRVKPFENAQIEVIGNLKRECFVDTDIDHLLFSYGARPTFQLTMFGLITSTPPEEYIKPDYGNHADEYDSESHEGRSRHFEASFRNVFNAMTQFESFSSFSHYPNIKVYPIAVYRKITSHIEIVD